MNENTYQIGQRYLIRTTTHAFIGDVASEGNDEILLKNATQTGIDRRGDAADKKFTRGGEIAVKKAAIWRWHLLTWRKSND